MGQDPHEGLRGAREVEFGGLPEGHIADLVRVDVDGHLATVTIDRPPVNAIDSGLREELMQAFAALEPRQTVWAVIVTGTERTFSVGVDIRELAAAPPADAAPRNRRYHEVFGVIDHFRAPVIAAINGYALGGGLELAMACDIRVAAEDAELGQPEVVLGGVPGAGGLQRLARLVGTGKAKQLIFTGDRISGAEARRIGLVEECGPPGGALEVARALAERIVSRPPLSVRAAKQAINVGVELPLDAALALDLRFVAEVADTEDRREGLRAFLEKRSPRVTGR